VRNVLSVIFRRSLIVLFVLLSTTANAVEPDDSVKTIYAGDSLVLPQEELILTDSLPKVRQKRDWKTWRPDVKRALWLALVIPGAGQIYNRKYWKLPIVYGALGISGYFVYDFAHQMVSYKKEFINRRDGNTSQLNPKYSIETDANILALKNTYRRRMEIAIAITAVLYVFNIVDAIVDAHLYYFDISDDLSLRVTPQINQNYNSSLAQQNNTTFNYGVNLTLNFK
jgi:hypothetical protein